MVNALEAGTIVAVLAAAVGWFMVLRRQTFAGHTLSVMAFPGAAGAALAGLPLALGYYLACGAAALAIGRTARGLDAAASAPSRPSIGTVQAVGPRRRLPVPVALPRDPRRAPRRSCSARSSASPSGQVLDAARSSPSAALALLALGGAARCCSRRSTADVARARGVPVGVARRRLPAAARARGRRDQPDHRRAARVRAARRPAGDRPAADHAAAGSGSLLSVAFALLVIWLGLGLAYFSTTRSASTPRRSRSALYVLAAAARRWARPLMFAHEFVRNAYLAGTFIALACGCVG